MQQPLIDFANAILRVYGSDPLSLVTAQREAWDAHLYWSVSMNFDSRCALSPAERNRRYPRPAPPAPEPVLSPDDVEKMCYFRGITVQDTRDFIRFVERAVLVARKEAE